MRVRHLRATPGGGRVRVSAEPAPGTSGGRLTFLVRAVDGSGAPVAEGETGRAVVDREKFLAG